MKKRVIIGAFIIFIILISSFVIADYVCSDDSVISKDSKEVREGERKSINRLGIGLIRADEMSVMKKIEAEIILEAEKVSLTNTSSSKEVEYSDGEYDIEMINATDNSAEIEVDNKEGEIEEGEYKRIGGLYVILTNADSSSGGSVELIAGTQKVILSSDEKPTETLTIDSENYLIELYSASDNSATIKVWKCKTGEVESLKEEEPEPVINQTDEPEEPEENQTVEDEETEAEEVEGEEDKSMFQKKGFWIVLVLIVIVIVGYISYRSAI